MKLNITFSYFLLIACLAIVPLHAQSASNAEDTSQIKIDGVDVQKAKLPNSTSEWTKLICNFTNNGSWMDGVSFNYSVLVQPANGGAEKLRVIAGGLTYMNVPKGKSQAIMYLSPSATARFGTPIAINVEVFRGDRSLGTFAWKSGGSAAPTDWMTQYSPYNGMLLNVRSTPWIFSDLEHSPDLITN